MAVSQRRTTMRKGIPKRRPLNLRTLQMMVQSGVVRRADFIPPSSGSRTRFHVSDDMDHDSTKEIVSEGWWFARLLLGRSIQLSISKRP